MRCLSNSTVPSFQTVPGVQICCQYDPLYSDVRPNVFVYFPVVTEWQTSIGFDGRSRLRKADKQAETVGDMGTLKRHWSGVLAFICSRITNGVVGGLAREIKTALKRAYGINTFENYRMIISLVAGKLQLPT